MPPNGQAVAKIGAALLLCKGRYISSDREIAARTKARNARVDCTAAKVRTRVPEAVVKPPKKVRGNMEEARPPPSTSSWTHPLPRGPSRPSRGTRARTCACTRALVAPAVSARPLRTYVRTCVPGTTAAHGSCVRYVRLLRAYVRTYVPDLTPLAHVAKLDTYVRTRVIRRQTTTYVGRQRPG